MSTEQLRSFLDELCGLGVLVRNINGHYRLLPRQAERGYRIDFPPLSLQFSPTAS